MAGPWDKYAAPQQAPQPVQQQPQQTPGVIMGRPKQISPIEQQRLDMEAERLRMAQQDQARQNQQGDLTARNTELDIGRKERDAAAGPVADAREGEANNAAFAGRARKALDEYNAAEEELGGPRSYAGGMVAAIPGGETVLRALPDAVGDNPTRRAAERAKLDFVNLILRSDSGAAVPEEEVARALKTYFPAPGETDPAVLESYRNARETALEGLQMKAGRLRATGDSDRAALPSASMGRTDPGIGANGVQDRGTGGLRSVPEFSGMAAQVQDLVQRGASADQVIAYVTKRHTDAGFPPPNAERQQFIRDVVELRERRPDVPASSLGQAWQNLEMVEEPDAGGTVLGSLADTNLGAAAIGAADTVTGGFLDEIAGALGGNTDNARAVMSASAEERPVSTFAGQVAGGAVLPIGRAGTAASLAKGGAAYGGVYGAGSATGDVGDRLTGAAVGSTIGGATGGLVGKGMNALSTQSALKSAQQTQRNALLQDFQAEGVQAMPANVGGTRTNRMTSGMAQSPIGSGPIRAAAKQQGEDFGQAVGNAAERSGRVMPADEAGESFRQSARAGIERDGQRIGRIYDAAKKEAAGVKIKPNQGIRQIDEEIAALSETREINQPLITELQKLKASLQQNTAMSIDGLKTARSFAGKAASNQELRATPAKATMARVFDALATDFEGGLRAAGKGKAATLFKRADGLWKARIEDIDGAWEPIIGAGKSGEDIVKSIETMATGGKGGFARLKTVLSGASPEERGDMIATLIDRMGHARKGAQNAEGDVFSPNVFLTNWNGMSKKAKALMFGNSELRQSLDRLSRISESVKDSAGFANSSNTGGAIAAQGLVGAAGYGVGNLPGLALSAGGTYLTGRLLASPRFAAWLARAPKNATPQAERAYTAKLKSIATAEPVIAADVNRFAQFLNAANDASPARAVAQGQQEDN